MEVLLKVPLPPGEHLLYSCAILSLAHPSSTAPLYENFRLIIHKMREGSIDGLTLVFSHEIGQWCQLSQVAELREMMNKLDAEEERRRNATKAAKSLGVGTEHMVFIPDEDNESMVYAHA